MEQNKRLIDRIFLTEWRPFAWLIFSVYAVYLQALTFTYTYFDDNNLILDNYWFNHDLGNWWQAFTRNVYISHGSFFYRPFLTLSFMLDAQLGGTALFVYQLTNLVLHSAAVVLVFVFLLRLGYRRGTALFFGLLFSLHPALAQAVAWVPGRNDSLLAVFTLGSFILLTGYVKKGSVARYLAHLLLFAAALFTKESAIALAPVALAYLYLIANVPLRSARTAKLAAGWAAVIAGWAVLRSLDPAGLLGLPVTAQLKILAGNLPAVVQYAGKALLPFRLSVFPTMKGTSFACGLAAVALIALAALVFRQARPRYALFGLAWFLLFLLPAFVVPDNIFFEHRLYLPIVGFFVLLAEVFRVPEAFRRPKAAAIAAGALVCLWGALAFLHAENFSGRTAFWSSAVATSPGSAAAHIGLGEMFMSYNLPGPAEVEFRTAVKLDPRSARAYYSLGRTLMAKNAADEAERAFRTTLRLNPGFDSAWYQLGVIAVQRGQDAEAERLWRRAVELNPGVYMAYANLALLYDRQGRGDDARRALEAFRRHCPPDARALLLEEWKELRGLYEKYVPGAGPGTAAQR